LPGGPRARALYQMPRRVFHGWARGAAVAWRGHACRRCAADLLLTQRPRGGGNVSGSSPWVVGYQVGSFRGLRACPPSFPRSRGRTVGAAPPQGNAAATGFTPAAVAAAALAVLARATAPLTSLPCRFFFSGHGCDRPAALLYVADNTQPPRQLTRLQMTRCCPLFAAGNRGPWMEGRR